jgi:hypothetical protein
MTPPTAKDVRLIRSPVSIAGMVLTTISAVAFLVVFLADLFGRHSNPYLGALYFLILPALFVLGLLLIPLGAWIERRRRAAGKPPTSAEWPRIDLNDPRQRTTAIIVFGLSIANLLIVSLGAHKGLEYMDSIGFCGQVCHTPMKPQFVAHQQGPHPRVHCAECHVGEGAAAAAEAKLAGTRRVVAVALGSYARPITATPDELVSSLETCATCHRPGQFRGDQPKRVIEYADDEKNTETVTVMRMHVGGGAREAGLGRGIHWHADPANQVEYVATDDTLQTIPYVRVTDASGAVREYVVAGTPAEQLSAARRRMECTDCHNRVGHPVFATPQRAVNEAMARGALPATLPFAHREAVKAVTATYESEEAAVSGISRALREFYASQPSQGTSAQDVERAVQVVQEVYRRNVFPEMNVKFGSYPSNIGHFDFPGCFRCHDDEHKAADGKTIGQDCSTCHTIE